VSLELAELALLQTDLEIEDVRRWRRADIGPLPGDVVSVLDSIRGAHRERRAQGGARSDEGQQG
jgi:hypothetical protein